MRDKEVIELLQGMKKVIVSLETELDYLINQCFNSDLETIRTTEKIKIIT